MSLQGKELFSIALIWPYKSAILNITKAPAALLCASIHISYDREGLSLMLLSFHLYQAFSDLM